MECAYQTQPEAVAIFVWWQNVWNIYDAHISSVFFSTLLFNVFPLYVAFKMKDNYLQKKRKQTVLHSHSLLAIARTKSSGNGSLFIDLLSFDKNHILNPCRGFTINSRLHVILFDEFMPVSSTTDITYLGLSIYFHLTFTTNPFSTSLLV